VAPSGVFLFDYKRGSLPFSPFLDRTQLIEKQYGDTDKHNADAFGDTMA
jgi:hypothetical protein